MSVVWKCPLFRGFYNRDFNYGRESEHELTVRCLEVSVSRGSTIFNTISSCDVHILEQ